MKKALICLTLLLFGCEKYQLAVTKERLSQNSLASTYVQSPDPLQKNPPKGQKLYLQWKLPKESFDPALVLALDVIFRDYTQQRYTFPISAKRGTKEIEFVGKDWSEKGGLLTYKAELLTPKGEVVKEWKQALWIELIQISD